MGNAKDVMWNQSGKHAMSAWRERQAYLWALETTEEVERMQIAQTRMTNGLECPNIPEAWRKRDDRN